MKNLILRWRIVFLLLVMILWQKGNDNPASRLAAMAAMTQYHTWKIDPYILQDYYTKDWARGPDGHLYSNKPPAPMIVGEPVFWLVDQVLMHDVADDAAARDQRRREDLPIYNWILSILFQAIPFALLAGLCLERLSAWGVSVGALQITAAAMFFGNTAGVLMNLYFGHPMAAWCVLAAWLMIDDDRWAWSAFFVSSAMVSDYGAIALVPGLLIAGLWRSEEKGRRLLQFVGGAAIPAIVGGIYHTQCFGRPWRTALQYQAPEFIDLVGKPNTFWGIFHLFPNPEALWQLLIGPTRGIFFTQPWILLVVIGGIVAMVTGQLEKHFRWAIFLLSGFFFIWIANACFGQWHGGWTIGPRYMSCLFPALALLGGVLYDRAARPLQILSWILVGVSLVLSILIYAGTPYVPQNLPLWPSLIHFVSFQCPLPRTLLRAGLLAGGWYWALTAATV